MRWRNSTALASLAAASVVAVWPAIAQRAPESILPPGFGQPEPSNTTTAPREGTRPDAEPTDLIPSVELRPPAPATSGTTNDVIGDLIEETGNSTSAMALPTDLPVAARRSLNRVGLLAPEDGGVASTAFGQTDGRFLSTLMQRTDAPLASRWASILLRRTLLSPTDTPAGVNGADWVAERAWLLLRMGEADMARALIARVDAPNFTPKLYAVAMQAALATADPAALCPVASAAATVSDEPSWPLAQAMCAGLSGEAGTASALIDKVRDDGKARGIDVLLAEKVVGAATNTRRSVSIQWDGVTQLTAWRFGMATATGVTVPAALFTTVGPQVGAWMARAPLIAPSVRAPFAEQAAAMGVLSSASLIDFYSNVWDATDEVERGGSTAEALRNAFTAGDDATRLSAIRALWTGDGANLYARQIMTARLAATFPVADSVAGDDLDRLVGSMLSAGLDIQAARWADSAPRTSLAWAQLAVGAPRALSGTDASVVRGIAGGADDLRIKFLFAGLAGLGRLSADQASALAQDYAVPLGRETSWTRALDRAATANEVATVVVLAAAGLQTREWRNVPPEHLYRIVAALRRVGLEPEARMIAAEALARA